MIEKIKKVLRNIRTFIIQKTTRINFYIYEGPALPVPPELDLVLIRNPKDLKRYHFTDIDSNHRKIFKDRLKKGDMLAMLVKDDNVISWGWIFMGECFYLFEINRTTCHKNNRFLYDFHTPKQFRNRGYYSTLLSNIPLNFPGETFTVGATSRNLPSNKGILKAGFVPYNKMSFCEKEKR